ncbi:hypothetical protein NKT77_09895 [Moraxella sp. FZLJ2107]|uniref:hypothetical protein n=1 Tax=unclassified Moraxella TaxID=2685852 RepID=UPI0020C8E7DB|nr:MULTISPECIES: hypothetical protein [unclassified Moraxella]UTO04799.1 hypothetical protein NKT77_09895 [Moraxella sp. FZLJ2107]UTO21531.1 hypothetical protein NKU06_06700 [Moraxella sp. FZLJ2109]
MISMPPHGMASIAHHANGSTIAQRLKQCHRMAWVQWFGMGAISKSRVIPPIMPTHGDGSTTANGSIISTKPTPKAIPPFIGAMTSIPTTANHANAWRDKYRLSCHRMAWVQ